MADNPWHVDSIQAFSFFKCPECIFDAKEEDVFQNHALENHPLSFALFGKTVKEEEVNDTLPQNDEIKDEEDFTPSNCDSPSEIKEDYDPGGISNINYYPIFDNCFCKCQMNWIVNENALVNRGVGMLLKLEGPRLPKTFSALFI